MSTHSIPRSSWVGAWYAAPTQTITANLSSRTLRQVVQLHAGGEHIGSNDLRFGVSAETIISGFQQIVKQARTRYQKVFGTTILPGGYSPEQAVQRQKVNRWIREQGSQWFDAIFEFAIPLCSPENEAVINPTYDSGDGIHPNDEGYRLMAEAVDIHTLTGSPAQ